MAELSVEQTRLGTPAESGMRKPLDSMDGEAGSALHGRVLVRFAHAYRSGAGVERLLDDLDGTLLQRNALTIVRLYVAREHDPRTDEIEEIGMGRRIWVPLHLPSGEALGGGQPSRGALDGIKGFVRDDILGHALVWPTVGRYCARAYSIPPRKGDVVDAGASFVRVLDAYGADLVMLHHFGAGDADEIIRECVKRGISFALQNHFSNERFSDLSVRKHVEATPWVSGVSGCGVPAYVANKFTNLADGIDTGFFQVGARTCDESEGSPRTILLPARLVREKGHLDLLAAARNLKQAGIKFRVAFAGRSDEPGFRKELEDKIAAYGLADDVEFLGILGVEELRSWYGRASVIALPTYHHEGLPRVILEAHAMARPVVAYDMGGVREGVADGVTGFVLEPGDIPGLTARLGCLLEDRVLSRQFAQAARNRAEERFGLMAAATRHEDFYASMLQREDEQEAAQNGGS